MIIREYNPKDKEAVLKCIVELQEFERTLEADRIEGSKMAEEYLDYLLSEKDKQNPQILLAEENAIVTGFISFWIEDDDVAEIAVTSHKYLYISDISVPPQYQKIGVGEALMKKAEEFAVSQKIAMIKVYVLARNKGAADFYHRLGYRDYEMGLVKELNKDS